MPAKTHGQSYTAEYRSWKLMLSRCRNPNDPAFKNYGERGISVCDRWHRYENFQADMGQRPTPKHTLERVDNNRGYSPENCRWATRAEQLRNRRNNVIVEIGGERMCQADAAAALGVSRGALRYHIARDQTARFGLKIIQAKSLKEKNNG